MKIALYNNGVENLSLVVIRQNQDGTYELGTNKDTLKVGACPADPNPNGPKEGYCLPYESKEQAKETAKDPAK